MDKINNGMMGSGRRRWKTIRLGLALLLCCPLLGQSQTGVRKNWGTAAGLTVVSNAAVWSFSRFVAHSDFAYIDINSIRANFKKGFVWDNDRVGTNMFLHPYHGSVYFDAARAGGFSFWESGAFATAGSLMWEMLMENEYPSINDIVVTPVGGLILGETLFRLSDIALDERATGAERLGREVAGFMLSPARGVTRLINGEAWRKSTTSGRKFYAPQTSVELSVGLRALELKDEIFDRGVGLTANIMVEYGDRFATETEHPYDYFLFNTHLHAQQFQPILGQVNIKGRLYSLGLIDKPRGSMSMGVYQHFDYYDSEVISNASPYVPYRFCAPAAFGVGFVFDNKRPKKWKMDSFCHANAILMGASLSDHYVVAGRNYNLGNGYSWQWGVNLSNQKNFTASLNYEGFLFHTWKGYDRDIDWNNIDPRTINAQGDESQAISQAFHLRLGVKVATKLWLTGTFTNYFRGTTYRHFDDVISQTSEGKWMLSYSF